MNSSPFRSGPFNSEKTTGSSSTSMETPATFEQYRFRSGRRRHSITGLKQVESRMAVSLERSTSQERSGDRESPPRCFWEIVKRAAEAAGIGKVAPQDLRRTCERLCRLAGGELDQIQFLLGHVSIQTTEHYLGCKQKLRFAVNDKIGIEP